MLGRAVLEPWAEEADEVTGDRTIAPILVGVKGLFLPDELLPGLQQLCRVPLAIRERRPGTPDGLLGQPQRGQPRDHGSSAQEQATAEEHPQEMKEAEIGANGHTLYHTRQDVVHPVDYGRHRASFLHIPPDLVVTPRVSHNTLDLSIRYPHDVSSAPTAICMEDETWDRPPNRPAKTAPSPSISTMNRPTFSCSSDGKAFVEFVLAFLLALGFQLLHKATCSGGGCLTRHSHYARVRLGGLTIWRIQCTTCKAVFTVLPHFVLRYRTMRPDVARDALIATHGGLSLEWCAVICHISPMALYRLICAFGQHSLVTVLTRCGLPLPTYILADEKHSRCLTERVYLPTIVRGRVLWHLGYSASKSAAAFTESYGEFQRAALAA